MYVHSGGNPRETHGGHDILLHLDLRLRPIHRYVVSPQLDPSGDQLLPRHGSCSMVVVLNEGKPPVLCLVTG